jgi:uncharacterized protein YndB with AHSA1/START domain
VIGRTGVALLGIAAAGRLVAAGAVTVDVGIGRRLRPLGPLTWTIEAPPEIVFDVVADPYLRRTPRALQHKLEVWQRGSDMALAAHFTDTPLGKATTVETVRFERPDRIEFRLLRGPLPHVSESFALRPVDSGTELVWSGELGTDFWALGAWWAGKVAAVWEQTVRASLESVSAEAERRARSGGA